MAYSASYEILLVLDLRIPAHAVESDKYERKGPQVDAFDPTSNRV
jgi:hypothetical protein